MAKFKFNLDVHARDRVTGFAGIILGRTEYATGCIQYGICPTSLVEGKYPEWQWLDESRLELVKKPSVGQLQSIGGPHPSAPTF